MNENHLNELKLKEKYYNFLKSHYLDRYLILRNNHKITFIDYNLIKVEKTYHIKLKNSKNFEGDINQKDTFITLPETYNTRRIHTPSLSIEINKHSMDLMESNDETLKRLICCYRIWIFNESNRKILLAKNELKKIRRSIFHSKLVKEYNKFEKIYEKYNNTLKSHFSEVSQEYLELDAKNQSNNKFDNLEEGEKKIKKYISTLNKKAKRNNYEFREKIARLTHNLLYLIESPYEQLIAIDIPKDFYNSNRISSKYSMNDDHITITLHTEESIEGYTDFQKKFILKSLFAGETAEFILETFTGNNNSTYYEIIPPENTRIAKITRGINTECCNILMETEDKPKRVKFKDKSNERFVFHIPRDIPRDKREKFKDFPPRFFIKLQPFKALQLWVCFSLILGIGFITFLSILFILHFIVSPDQIGFLTFLVELARFQAFSIYGLIIGNQLWLQKPRFLWKNSTYLAIIIIIAGISLLITCIVTNKIIVYNS